MLQKIASLITAAGLAALLPPAYFFLLRQEHGAPESAAILATALLFALSWGALLEAAALAASAAALISGLVLLPLLGAKTAALLGISLLAIGLTLRGRVRPALAVDKEAAWVIALAAGAAMAWTRCLSLLIGHPHYAFTLTVSALFLGFALGAWLKKYLDESLAAAPSAQGLALLFSGVSGLLALRFFRFIGINSGGAHYIQFHLHTRADALFIAGQAYAVLCLWAAALAYAGQGQKKPGLPILSWCLALAGPAAGCGLLPLLGPAKTAALFNLALVALGFFNIGWSALRSSPVLAKTAAVIAAIGIGLTAANPDPFRDVWLNRLNAAYPGGNFLFLNDDGRESLGVYRFSTGAKVLLSDGIASFSAEPLAKRAAFLPLLLRPAVKSALLLGVRDAAAINALLSQSVSVAAVDPHPSYPAVLKALDEKIKLEENAQFSIIKNTFRRRLRDAASGYDLILLELPGPLETARNAFHSTDNFFSLIKARLNPAGAAIVRMPAASNEASRLRVAKTLQTAFPHVIACRLGNSILLFASDEPFNTQPDFLKTRISSDLWIFDPGLESFLQEELVWLDEETLKSQTAALGSQSDDRPLNAFPLYDIMSRSSHD